jgi:hypothetical protein
MSRGRLRELGAEVVRAINCRGGYIIAIACLRKSEEGTENEEGIIRLVGHMMTKWDRKSVTGVEAWLGAVW